MPGVTKDYTASVAATVTSSATAAALTVRDPSATATGRLVNGTAALPQPLQLEGRDDGAFAPLAGTALRAAALSHARRAHAVTIDLKQSIAATDRCSRAATPRR